MTNPLQGLASESVLRAAINTGNRALVQKGASGLQGISPALARRLASNIGAGFEPVIYNGAGDILADAGKGIWDLAFLAIDPKRAKKVAFTRPYMTIEATFAVRAGSSIQSAQDADQENLRILKSIGSAYDLYLTNSLQKARLERFGTPPVSFEAFRAGNWDAVAGVRESLEQAFGADPQFRVLSGLLTKVQQAMVLPIPEHPLLGALDTFVALAIQDGFVASAS